MIHQTNQPILLFDGVCNLCNSSVQFVIKRDHDSKIKFAALQSAPGQYLLSKFDLPVNDFDSFVFIDGEKYYTRSTAVLKVLKTIGGWYQLLYIFIIVPAFIRNWIYTLVAKNRYRVFGRQE